MATYTNIAPTKITYAYGISAKPAEPMRLTIDDLKVAAVATRNYDYFSGAWVTPSGRPCPASAICDFRGSHAQRSDIYTNMCELFAAASRSSRAHFDVHLATPDGRDLIAGIFDSIIVCADPTWSSREGKEPMYAKMLERRLPVAYPKSALVPKIKPVQAKMHNPENDLVQCYSW